MKLIERKDCKLNGTLFTLFMGFIATSFWSYRNESFIATKLLIKRLQRLNVVNFTLKQRVYEYFVIKRIGTYFTTTDQGPFT